MDPKRDKLLACATIALLMAGAAGLVGSVQWIGEPFPGFLVLENRVVASAGLSRWPATVGGQIYQHQVLAANGAPLASAEEIWQRVRAVPVGTPITYRLQRGDRVFDSTISTRRFEATDFALLFGAYLLNGLAMAGAALGIRFLRGSHPLANATFPLLLVSALWGLTAMDLYGPYRLFRVHALCEVLLFPAAIHMALAFPSPLSLAERCPRLVPASYALAAPLALLYQLGLHEPRIYVACHQAATLAMGGGLALLIASQVARFVRPRSFEARQRVKALALGAVGALGPPVVLTLSSALTGGRAPQNLIAFTAFLFPLSIGYAVIRHNLLEVDALIRRSLGYAVLTLVVTAGYLGSIALLERVFGAAAIRQSNVFTMGFALVCVGLLLPLRNRLQAAVDRVFFRTAYDFRRVVETTSARLAAVTELSVIADELIRAVDTSLHPESIALYARSAKNDALAPVVELGRVAVAPGDRLELIESAAGPFDLEDGSLSVPLRTPDLLVGALLLGRRRSGAIYGGDDRRLLQTLANQGAVAVHNAMALEKVRELNRSLEIRVEERTRDLRKANERLRELSSTDPVTGLRTRRYLMDALSREFHRYRRSGAEMALVMFDLDHFKRVNDTFGHLAGDETLRWVGNFLNSHVRAPDTAARYGGEEMMLVLSDTTLEGAVLLAERLRGGIEHSIIELPRGETLQITVSIGIAMIGPQHGSTHDLIEAVDAALYLAKQGGRNRVEIAT